jgi:hypothetical protein
MASILRSAYPAFTNTQEVEADCIAIVYERRLLKLSQRSCENLGHDPQATDSSDSDGRQAMTWHDEMVLCVSAKMASY